MYIEPYTDLGTTMIFADKSRHMEDHNPPAFPGFCHAEAYTIQGTKTLVYMQLKRWREIRTAQSLCGTHRWDLSELGYAYLGDIVRRWDADCLKSY